MGRENPQVLHLNPCGSGLFQMNPSIPSPITLYFSSIPGYFIAPHKRRFCCPLCLCPLGSSRMGCFSFCFEWLILAQLLKPSSVITSSRRLSVTLQGFLPLNLCLISPLDWALSRRHLPNCSWCPSGSTLYGNPFS